MNIKYLNRVGVGTLFVLLTLPLAIGQAHAFSICIPFIGCFGSPTPSPHSVPEIDAGMAVGGVALLVASALILIERFRR